MRKMARWIAGNSKSPHRTLECKSVAARARSLRAGAGPGLVPFARHRSFGLRAGCHTVHPWDFGGWLASRTSRSAPLAEAHGRAAWRRLDGVAKRQPHKAALRPGSVRFRHFGPLRVGPPACFVPSHSLQNELAYVAL
jgi:hypothetical protein